MYILIFAKVYIQSVYDKSKFLWCRVLVDSDWKFYWWDFSVFVEILFNHSGISNEIALTLESSFDFNVVDFFSNQPYFFINHVYMQGMIFCFDEVDMFILAKTSTLKLR